jgi:hypothetical protein
MVAPGMFKGRIDEIDSIERCLFQTKNESPVHFLIEGERGIGKSSLFYLIDMLARGDVNLHDDETKFNFMVLTVDLGGAVDQLDIVRAIARQLKKKSNELAEVKAAAKAFWDWISKWEVLGVRYHAEKFQMDTETASDDLIDQIGNLCEALGDRIDGILILIDEADRPASSANLGALCKQFTERLEKSGCSKVVFGLAALPVILSRLRESHESSPRIFTTMLLLPLSDEECKAVIKLGLKHAEKTNNEDVAIDDDALALIASLSEGYPHFLQQFAYSAFEACSTDRISFEDVLKGAFGENGALSQLGAKYFNEMYHAKIASNDYRKVLNTMAEHGDDWVSRKEIIAESKLGNTTVTNALTALKARNIIVSDESRKNRGFYKLPTKSFAVWIKAVSSLKEQTGRSTGDLLL